MVVKYRLPGGQIEWLELAVMNLEFVSLKQFWLESAEKAQIYALGLYKKSDEVMSWIFALKVS